ncbi:MAG: thiamine pyrophosphate-binding protein [Chloroflexi bacterium]|nr:thiamine pyrophosphate-binding protein [Chloroflexota bacterium]
MEQMSGSKLLVEALKANGVKYLVGIHGTGTLALLDVLFDEPAIQVITVRHEETSPFACGAYAKITGRPAVCFSIQGPGSTNMVTSVTSSNEDSVPMVVISAQVANPKLPAGHACDLEAIYRPITKEVITIREVAQIPACINRAFQVATEGRNGPVMVLFPLNMFTAKGEAEIIAPEPRKWVPGPGLDAELEQAAAMLERAEAPALFAGGGVTMAGASTELQELAEKLSAPVFTSRSNRGCISETHPLCCGTFFLEGSTDVLAHADACLALGTRFSAFGNLEWKVRFPDQLIEVNISRSTMGLVYKPKLAIVADAKYVLRKLIGMVGQKKGNGPTLAELEKFKKKREQDTARFMAQKPVYPLHPLWMVKKLRECLSPETVVICDSTSAVSWINEPEFPILKPRTLLANDGFGSMGYPLPAAIGVKLAAPDSEVVCIVGDGSFMMQMSELATAADHNLSIPVIVMNDGVYGVLWKYQKYGYKGRFIGTDLNNPDFLKIAEAFHIAGHRVASPDEFQATVRQALRRRGPTVIDVPVNRLALPRLTRSRMINKGLISEAEAL